MPKISALPPMTTADAADEAPIVDTSATTTKKWTLTLLKTYLQSLTAWVTSTMLVGIDKSLLTTDSNPYKFKAYRNAALTTAVGYQKIVLDTELFDTNNNFATGTFTAPVSGFYQFNFQATISILATSNDTVAALYKNGVVETWGMEIESQGGTGGADLIQLTAGDTIELWLYTQAASALIATKMGTRLSGNLVCRT